TATDEHCFSWIYGGKFVRDEHVVHRDGRPDEFGESIYVWDGAARELQYLYIESAGGFSRGTVALEGATLVFPPTRYVEKGVEQTYRSRWQHAASGEYDVITEFQVKGAWVPGFSLHMQQVSGARGRAPLRPARRARRAGRGAAPAAGSVPPPGRRRAGRVTRSTAGRRHTGRRTSVLLPKSDSIRS